MFEGTKLPDPYEDAKLRQKKLESVMLPPTEANKDNCTFPVLEEDTKDMEAVGFVLIFAFFGFLFLITTITLITYYLWENNTMTTESSSTIPNPNSPQNNTEMLYESTKQTKQEEMNGMK